MTAREQLLEAQRLGHVLSVRRRDLGDKMPPKFWLDCTCGYSSTARRSEKALMGTLIWHVGKVLGEGDTRNSEIRRNGGSVRQTPAL